VIKKTNVLVLASICALAFAACTTTGGGGELPRVSGRTFFVAPSGSDGGSGTVARPFRTFAKALSVLQPGDALYARGGTYNEQVKATNITSGTPTRRILVRNYPGERPVIDGELWLAYPSYWTVSGINVHRGAATRDSFLVNVYGGTGWVFERAEIWGGDTAAAGMLVGDGNHNNLGTVAVRENCIHDNKTNVYLDDYTSSRDPNVVVERNIIYSAYSLPGRPGRGVKLGPPDEVGGPKNVVVRYNTIYGAYRDVSLSRDASHNRIYDNILADANEANIGTYHLRGRENIVTDNIGFGAAHFVLGALTSFGNRVAIDPAFDSIGCGGFHPRAQAAQGYGRYAHG
jgi:hypothetical protein